jgi:hypothetical protein
MNLKDLNPEDIEVEESQALNLADLDDFELEENQEIDSPDISKTESALRGAAQGATFGTSDEIVGAAETATSLPKRFLESLFPTAGATEGSLGYDIENPSGSKEDFYKQQQEATLGLTQGQEQVLPQGLEALLGDYRKGRDESRSANVAAQEANPMSFLGGELFGGAATAPFTGGAGAIGNISKVGLSKALPALVKAGIKQGAAAGAGYSESDLTEGEVGELATDIGIGAGVGGALGAALPIAGAGVKKLGGIVGDMTPETLKEAGKAFKYGTQGIPTTGKRGQEALTKDTLSVANEIVDKFRKQYTEGSKMINKALNADGGKKVNFSNQLRELDKAVDNAALGTDDAKILQSTINEFKELFTKETVDSGTERALADLQKKVNTQIAKGQPLGERVSFTAPEVLEDLGVARTVKRGQNALGEDIADVITSNIPEDRLVTETFDKFRSLNLSELSNLKQELGKLAFGGRLDPKSTAVSKRLYSEIDSLIENKLPVKSREAWRRGNDKRALGYQASELFPELAPDRITSADIDIPFGAKLQQDSFKQGESLDRVMNKYLSIPDENLAVKAQTIADRKELVNALNQESGKTSIVRNLLLKTGETAGLSISPAAKGVSNFNKALMEFSDDNLMRLSNIMDSGNAEWMKGWSGAIKRSVGDDKAKNKILWSLSQQPAFREFVTELINSEDNINE